MNLPLQNDGRDAALRRPRPRTSGRNKSNLWRKSRPPLRRWTRRGQRSAPSLPFKFRPFAITKINERPIFQTCNQTLAHRICQNVIRFLTSTLVVPQTMLKEIALPDDADFFGSPLLPFRDNLFERLSRRRKRQKCMQMIRHEQKQIRPPQKRLLSMPNCFKQFFSYIRQSELIHKTLVTVDGNKIDLLLRIHPQRHLMRQAFATRNFHSRKIKRKNRPRQAHSTWAIHPRLVETPRYGVPARAVGTNPSFLTNHTSRCAAERGADGAARRPYPPREIHASSVKLTHLRIGHFFNSSKIQQIQPGTRVAKPQSIA